MIRVFFKAKNSFLQFMKILNNAASVESYTATPSCIKSSSVRQKICIYIKLNCKFYGYYKHLKYDAVIIFAVHGFDHWVSDVSFYDCKHYDYNSQRQRILYEEITNFSTDFNGVSNKLQILYPISIV